ncbi:MAG: glycosyltransferase [candidate division Zixibacteria bacterium]|nr:glycosyltransferase [candidate division Zixibacteria bacterium]
MKKRVLIISYNFPPLGGGGVQRTLKFAKYLPLFEWEPVILSVSNPDSPIWDHSLLSELPPDIKTIRVFSFEITRWERKFLSFFKSRIKSSNNKKEVQLKSSGNANPINPRLKSFFKKIYLFLTSWLRIPDHKVGWIPFALLEGLSLINSRKIDLIYVTSPPHSSQLLGLLLSKLTRKPWVADFRDDWLEDVYKISKFSRLRLKFEKYLSRKVFSKASYVIANTEFKKEIYQRNYPEAKGIETIYNGFDAEDLNRAKQAKDRWQDDKFHICHSGYFYPGTALPLLEILKDFFCENPALRGKIQFDVVGYLEQEYREWISRNNLSGEIKYWGYVDHISSVNFLLKSHLLLHLTGSGGDFWKGVVAGKLFEYLASGKPILSFTQKDGESEKIISQSNSGWVFSLTEPQEIKDKLKELYRLYLKDELRVEQNKLFIQEFERKNLTQKLSSVFEKCLS